MTAFPAINPATGQAFAETVATPPEQVAELVRQARMAQPAWAARPLSERLAVVREFQRRFYAHRIELAELVARENGKPVAEALLTDIAVTLDLARYYLGTAASTLRPRPVPHGNIALLGKRGRLSWEPLGVLGVISPWNYPLLLPFGEILPGLIAGNAVILKPSDFTTRTALLGVRLLHDAGLPPALCQVAAGGAEVGRALVAAEVDKVFFTGSARAGRDVAVTAAGRFLPFNLELGGSDPAIVLADADLDRTASGICWARFSNGGQTCVAAKRVIAEAPVHDRLVALLAARIAELRLGPGTTPGSDVGPLIRERQVEELERQLAGSVARGARVLCGGRRRPDLGPTFFEPTLLADVPTDAPIWREESFGPILPVVAARDAEDAVRIANESSYGLSASVWTRDRERGKALARRIVAGAVLVNDATSHVGTAEVPHGGEKESGMGRTHGQAGLLETCRPLFVGEDLLDRIRKPWWFGYPPESLADRDAFLRLAYAPGLLERVRAIPGALRLLFNRRPI